MSLFGTVIDKEMYECLTKKIGKMKTVNEIIETVNKNGEINKEQFTEIINAIFTAEDVDDVDMTNEEYNENRIYYKEVDGFDCEVTKWDETIEDGFELWFSVCAGCDDDEVASVRVESIADLYGAVAIIAAFDRNPFETVINLKSNEN